MPFDLPIRLTAVKAPPARCGLALFLALLAPIASTESCPAATAQGAPDLNGLWKLVAQSSGDQEWIIFEIKQSGGKSTIEMIDGPKNFPEALGLPGDDALDASSSCSLPLSWVT